MSFKGRKKKVYLIATAKKTAGMKRRELSFSLSFSYFIVEI